MNDSQALERVRAHLLASADAQRRSAETCSLQILAAARLIASALQAGGKLMLSGNREARPIPSTWQRNTPTG